MTTCLTVIPLAVVRQRPACRRLISNWLKSTRSPAVSAAFLSKSHHFIGNCLSLCFKNCHVFLYLNAYIDVIVYSHESSCIMCVVVYVCNIVCTYNCRYMMCLTKQHDKLKQVRISSAYFAKPLLRLCTKLCTLWLCFIMVIVWSRRLLFRPSVEHSTHVNNWQAVIIILYVNTFVFLLNIYLWPCDAV